ncbi:hypothetical protein HYX08_04520 [Candidatus Woesearchaeota archaeon]|nr:hypothetical protein [Candidatus Woesearchaeota archaeon]
MQITNQIVKIACEYYKRGNSLTETAEYLNRAYNFKVSPYGIGKRLRKIGVKLRSDVEGVILRTRKHIDIQKLLENYNNKVPIRELSRNSKIARGTIRKILVENGVSIMDSRSAQLAIGYIKEKKKFNLSSQEKAYIYGLVMGDLTPVRKSNYTLKLITHSTHLTFVKLLYNIFNKYGISSYKETKLNGMFRFQTHLDLESFSFLLDTKNGKVPDWINSNNFFYFLAGFIDSDGSVMLKRMHGGIFYGIRLFGQNLNLLIGIKDKLNNLDYKSSIHLSHCKGHKYFNNGILFKYNKDYYILETKRSQAISLLKDIPIKHPEKIMKRDLIFKIYNKGIVHWCEIEEEVIKLRFIIKDAVKSKTDLSPISP